MAMHPYPRDVDDSRRGQAQVRIAADRNLIWDMVADVTRMGDWSPETSSCEWVDGASGPTVGARFKGSNRRGKAKWSTTCEVIAADRGREFAFAVGGADKPSTVWRFVLDPGTDGVVVTESFEMAKPLSAFSRLVTRAATGVSDRRADLEAGAAATLAALKVAAEAGTET